jgi:hypothetical protein
MLTMARIFDRIYPDFRDQSEKKTASQALVVAQDATETSDAASLSQPPSTTAPQAATISARADLLLISPQAAVELFAAPTTATESFVDLKKDLSEDSDTEDDNGTEDESKYDCTPAEQPNQRQSYEEAMRLVPGSSDVAGLLWTDFLGFSKLDLREFRGYLDILPLPSKLALRRVVLNVHGAQDDHLP